MNQEYTLLKSYANAINSPYIYMKHPLFINMTNISDKELLSMLMVYKKIIPIVYNLHQIELIIKHREHLINKVFCTYIVQDINIISLLKKYINIIDHNTIINTYMRHKCSITDEYNYIEYFYNHKCDVLSYTDVYRNTIISTKNGIQNYIPKFMFNFGDLNYDEYAIDKTIKLNVKKRYNDLNTMLCPNLSMTLLCKLDYMQITVQMYYLGCIRHLICNNILETSYPVDDVFEYVFLDTKNVKVKNTEFIQMIMNDRTFDDTYYYNLRDMMDYITDNNNDANK